MRANSRSATSSRMALASPYARSGQTTGTAFWRRSGRWKRIRSTPGSSAPEKRSLRRRARSRDQRRLRARSGAGRDDQNGAGRDDHRCGTLHRERLAEHRTLGGAGVHGRREDYQGRGIASRLLAHLAALARSQRLTHFEADVLSQNSAMFAVFRRCGFPMRQRRDGGVVHLTLELAANDSAVG